MLKEQVRSSLAAPRALPYPQPQRKSRNERRPSLEVRGQKVHEPPEQRSNRRRMPSSRPVCLVEQVLEARGHACPVYLDEGLGAEVLYTGYVVTWSWLSTFGREGIICNVLFSSLVKSCNECETYLEKNKHPSEEERDDARALLHEHSRTNSAHCAEREFVEVHRRLRWRR